MNTDPFKILWGTLPSYSCLSYLERETREWSGLCTRIGPAWTHCPVHRAAVGPSVVKGKNKAFAQPAKSSKPSDQNGASPQASGLSSGVPDGEQPEGISVDNACDSGKSVNSTSTAAVFVVFAASQRRRSKKKAVIHPSRHQWGISTSTSR